MTTTSVVRMSTAALRRLPVHRYAGLFRPLEGDERERLRESMQQGYDVLHPIVVDARSGAICDGRNRRDLCCELELDDVPVVEREFTDDAEIAAFVVAANLARRHLSTRERRELAGRLVVNGASTRHAAKDAGVSEATARRAATEARAGASSDAPAAERVVGADGKTYPATRPKPDAERLTTSATEQAPAHDRLGATRVLRDAPLEEVEQIVASLPRERKKAIAAAAGHKYLKARQERDEREARLTPEERRERESASEQLSRPLRQASGTFASLGIVGHIEQATDELRELTVDASLTLEAVREIGRADDAWRQALDFARALLGEGEDER